MSVNYTSLNQGQTEKNQPNDAHSGLSAPMAKVETVGLDGPEEEVNRVSSLTTNQHHKETPEDGTSNKNLSEDHLDGHLGDNSHYRSGMQQMGIGVGLNFDTELGSLAGDTIPDINVYQHKKTLAQGMMDLALFSANANQLRYVLDSYQRHPYYWPSFIFIVLSLALQVAIGIGLTWNALYNVKDEKEICIANKINNFTVIGIFLVVVVNVFISAFGVADPIPPTAAVVVTPGT